MLYTSLSLYYQVDCVNFLDLFRVDFHLAVEAPPDAELDVDGLVDLRAAVVLLAFQNQLRFHQL